MRNYKLPLETINYALRNEIPKSVIIINGVIGVEKGYILEAVKNLLSPNVVPNKDEIKLVEENEIVIAENLGRVTLSGQLNIPENLDYRIEVKLVKNNKGEINLIVNQL